MEAEAVKGEGERIMLHRAANAQQEATFIAGQIQNLVEFGGHKYEDVAILVRNWNLTREIEQVFAAHGIPYDVVNGLKFFERKLIKDTLAALTLIQNWQASAPAKRVAGLYKGVGTAKGGTIDQIQTISDDRDIPFLQAMPFWVNSAPNGVGKNGITRFMSIWSTMWRTFPRPDEAKLTDILNTVWRATEIGYVTNEGLFVDLEVTQKHAKKNEKNVGAKEALENERRNLMELWGMAKRAEEQLEGSSLTEFLENIALVSQADDNKDGNAVKMLTVHGAKGLEWPVVFLPAFEQNVFPGMRDMATPDAMDEARRLAYVAITRAKDELYITRAAERMLYGQTMYNSASRFLNELPPYLITEV